MFNTLKSAKMLEEAGFSREQAEASVRVLMEVMDDKLATKEDISDLRKDFAELRTATQKDIADLRTATQQDIASLRTTTQQDMKHGMLQLKHDLTLRCAAMISAAVTLTAAVVTVLQKFG